MGREGYVPGRQSSWDVDIPSVLGNLRVPVGLSCLLIKVFSGKDARRVLFHVGCLSLPIKLGIERV